MSRILPRTPAVAPALGVVLTLTLILAAAPATETPGALEQDPSGWTDLLAGAGPG
jgi:hypothetical protein